MENEPLIDDGPNKRPFRAWPGAKHGDQMACEPK